MISIRSAATRGHADYGWLQTWHSFSFADYHDPAEMGWGALRVINEDIVAPGQGFPMHGHRDMEIVTVILSGALEHRDSMGNGEVIRPGEIQRMSAGTGVRHSEFNPSPGEPAHLLQIWLQPAATGRAPGYEQRTVDPRAGFVWLASPEGREGSVTIGQDATLQRGHLSAGERVAVDVLPQRHGYVHVIDGTLSVNGVALGRGDGAKLRDEARLEFIAGSDSGSDFLLFDTP